MWFSHHSPCTPKPSPWTVDRNIEPAALSYSSRCCQTTTKVVEKMRDIVTKTEDRGYSWNWGSGMYDRNSYLHWPIRSSAHSRETVPVQSPFPRQRHWRPTEQEETALTDILEPYHIMCVNTLASKGTATKYISFICFKLILIVYEHSSEILHTSSFNFPLFPHCCSRFLLHVLHFHNFIIHVRLIRHKNKSTRMSWILVIQEISLINTYWELK